MRALLIGVVLVSLLAAIGACQRFDQNNPAHMSTNPNLQLLRDSRTNGLRTRCATCHQAPEFEVVTAIR